VYQSPLQNFEFELKMMAILTELENDGYTYWARN